MSIYRRVLRYYRPFLPQTIVGLLLSVVGIALNLLKPWPFKIIVDNIIPHPRNIFLTTHSFGLSRNIHLSTAEQIALLCLALVVLQFLWGVINWITNYLLVKVGLQALLKLRTDLYAY